MSSQIEFLTTQLPDGGTAQEIAPGVLWIRMPLPFQLDHINLWMIEESDGWTLVDSGINTNKTKELWQALLPTLANDGHLERLICTHSHPDHMGLAGWFDQEFGVKLTATIKEWKIGEFFSRGREDGDEEFTNYFRRAGCDDTQVQQISDQILGTNHVYFAIPETCTEIVDGDTLEIGGRHWRVITTYGHSIEHACLYCEEDNILIGGDQILPKITPTIILQPHDPDSDPLRDFLESNEKLRPLPEDTIVLPSHNLPFKGLHARLDEYQSHHGSRLEMTFDACAQESRAIDVAQSLFRSALDPHQLFFAVGETLSHIRYLETNGQVSAAERDDGVALFKQAA